MELLYKIIISLLCGIGIFCIFQKIIKKLLKKILNDIRSFNKENTESVKLVEDRQKKFWYIVFSVSIIEFSFFGLLFFKLLRDNNLTDSDVGIFFQFFVGWLAIKMIPNYSMWSHKEVGKAYFYRSFFGNMLSILAGVIFGIVIYIIFIGTLPSIV